MNTLLVFLSSSGTGAADLVIAPTFGF